MNDSLGSTIAIFIFVLVGLLAVSIGMHVNSEIKVGELGQAICDQQHGADFESYSNGRLTCQPKPLQREYDGIMIEINLEANS